MSQAQPFCNNYSCKKPLLEGSYVLCLYCFNSVYCSTECKKTDYIFHKFACTREPRYDKKIDRKAVKTRDEIFAKMRNGLLKIIPRYYLANTWNKNELHVVEINVHKKKFKSISVRPLISLLEKNVLDQKQYDLCAQQRPKEICIINLVIDNWQHNLQFLPFDMSDSEIVQPNGKEVEVIKSVIDRKITDQELFGVSQPEKKE